ncbi:MAG TPA: DNA-formamidopyrimidine glycosylase family protein [bacterium]|nr:DNA-formamidopyrimidine glycosylase family protein [bacterium]
MPELPEVETARRSLVRAVGEKIIDRGAVLRPVAVRTHTPQGFARAVRGAVVEDVARHGKALWFMLGRWVLVFHYKLWGVIRFHAQAPETDKGAALLLVFTDGTALEFRDLQLSSFHLVKTGTRTLLDNLGIEPLAPTTTFEVFRRALGPKGAVKDLLCDQERIAGIGNLWAHEILFRARIRPDRKVESLTPTEARTLYRITRETLRQAVEAGGEPEFQDAFGRAGRYRLAVYGAAGKPCPVCGTKVLGGRFHGRPTFYCPSCQR